MKRMTFSGLDEVRAELDKAGKNVASYVWDIIATGSM